VGPVVPVCAPDAGVFCVSGLMPSRILKKGNSNKEGRKFWRYNVAQERVLSERCKTDGNDNEKEAGNRQRAR